MILVFLLLVGLAGSERCMQAGDGTIEVAIVQEVSPTFSDTTRMADQQWAVNTAMLRRNPALFITNVGFNDYSPATCYYPFFNMQRSNALTDGLPPLKAVIDRDKNLGRADKKSSLTAALLSATRTSDVGFTSGIRDPSGRLYVRMIILITATPSVMVGESGMSQAFRGDGTDTCNNDAPSLDKTRQVLEERNNYLIVITDRANGPTWQTYQNQVGVRMWLGVVDNILSFDTKIIDEALEGVLCEVTTTTTTGAPTVSTASTTGQPGTSTSKEEEEGGGGPNVGVIVGSAIGGVAALAAAGLLGYKFMSRETPPPQDFTETQWEDEADAAGMGSKEINTEIDETMFT